MRGGESILLTAETLAEMQRARPAGPGWSTFPGVGHAPALMAQDQIDVIVGLARGLSPSRRRSLGATSRAT